MDLITLASEAVVESAEMERAQPLLEKLGELELCLIGGGMGDVLQ